MMRSKLTNPHMLTKSRFIRYLQCPRYLWLGDHDEAELNRSSELEQERMVEEGEEVEVWARRLFPKGERIRSFHKAGERDTKQAIEKGAKVLYQATAIGDGLLAMSDILIFNPEKNVWDIFEVKGSTEVKPKHLYDVCFQMLAYKRAGYTIGTLSIVHINRDYVREGTIDPKGLLLVEDVTEAACALTDEVEAHIPKAKRVMELTEEPTPEEFPCGCTCKNSPCPTHCFAGLTEYPVYELRGISMKKTTELAENGIQTVSDVPDDFPLNDVQLHQVLSAKRGEPLIDRPAIKEILDSFTYPIYFFDYETFSSIVPPFDGFHPNETMPFQYSLHILKSPTSEVEHREFLAQEYGNTMPAVASALIRDIKDDGGTVIAWNKGFEIGCNEGIARLVPEHAAFLLSVNDRIFDLMEVFSKQHYIDYRFRGSYSLKKVLPVVIPHLSYKELDVQEGMTASLIWKKSFGMTTSEREQIFRNLLEYCKLDTLAMVEIWQLLQDL